MDCWVLHMFRSATWLGGLQTNTAANLGPGYDLDFPNEIKQSVSGSRICVCNAVYTIESLLSRPTLRFFGL